MRSMNTRSISLAAVLLIPAAARADQVDLVCNAAENVALVRFTTSGDAAPVYPRLPQKLDRGLSGSSGSARTDCTLADGTAIRVRAGQEQAFAYGMGGANPPAFFSLWINQRKVFSRKVWKPGYAESADNPPIYDGLLIAANRITICETAEGKAQRCNSQPLDLGKAPVDLIEYGPTAQKAVIGSFSVIAKGEENQRFCKDYLGLVKPGIDGALQGQPTSLDIDIDDFAKAERPDAYGARYGLLDMMPGVNRRLVIWSGNDHYFDGTVVALAPSRTTMQDMANAYPFDDIEAWPGRAAPKGVTLVSGGQKQLYPGVSSRYVHLVPQRGEGGLYFFAYPTNISVRPTAALVKPLADGGFITMCAFNRVEPHY